MRQRLQISRKADSFATQSEETQFQLRPSTPKTLHRTNKPLSQTDIENQEFQQHQIEATKLQLQAKQGTITPEGQTQLTLLQAKMNDVLYNRVEQGSGFGHNLGHIAFRHPERMPSSGSSLPIQAQLSIGQSGDQYEQEADKVASTVVSQVNQDQIQKQEISQTATNQNQAGNVAEGDQGVADPKQLFLNNYVVAKELVKGIDENAPQEKILEQLLFNFKNISFKYTMNYKEGKTLLAGTREGDCKTLAEAFQMVAQEYFGIQNVTIEQIKKPFLSEAAETIYQGKKRNCDHGKRWFFPNHYWATWNNKIYDVLFQSQKRPEVDMARQDTPNRTLFMPDNEYYETEKGKVVYPSMKEYFTIELSTFEKLRNSLKNISGLMYQNMDDLISRIQSLLAKGGNSSSELESLIEEMKNNRDGVITQSK
jgi:hypothetical protein